MQLRGTAACWLSLACVLALGAAILAVGAPRAHSETAPSPTTPVSDEVKQAQTTGNTGSDQPPAPAAPDPAGQPQPAVPPPSAEAPGAPSSEAPATTPPTTAGSAETSQPPAALPQQPQPGMAAEPPSSSIAAEPSLPSAAPPSAPEGTANESPMGAGQAEPAPAAAVPPATTIPKDLPRDLSPLGMFQAADIVVKAVMIGLALASFVTWTVWLAKAVELAGAKRRLRNALGEIRSAHTLGDAVERFVQTKGTGAFLVREAAEEVLASAPALDHTDGQGIKERVTSRLARAEAAAGRRMTLGTGVLATIGATAPFVGLFGTVWGIMNAFIGISEAQTTNLAVVAPGIAEALLATAFGLVAAIPAVIIYNVFARSIAGYRLLLADASAGIERLVSRDLDFRRIPQSATPAALVRARAAE